MTQMARNLTDPFSGFLKGKKHLIHDRDPLFTKEFRLMVFGSHSHCSENKPKSISSTFPSLSKSAPLCRYVIRGQDSPIANNHLVRIFFLSER